MILANRTSRRRTSESAWKDTPSQDAWHGPTSIAIFVELVHVAKTAGSPAESSRPCASIGVGRGNSAYAAQVFSILAVPFLVRCVGISVFVCRTAMAAGEFRPLCCSDRCRAEEGTRNRCPLRTDARGLCRFAGTEEAGDGR